MKPRNLRDQKHLDWALLKLQRYGCKSLLDIGCFDSWLGSCLIDSIGDLSYTGIDKQDGGWMSHGTGDRRWDACTMFEVLEHIPLKDVQAFVSKAVHCTNQLMMASLPDQKMEDNPIEHLWTPSIELIKTLFPMSIVDYISYPGTQTPGNWLIAWEII